MASPEAYRLRRSGIGSGRQELSRGGSQRATAVWARIAAPGSCIIGLIVPPAPGSRSKPRIGVDTGGTFTDLVWTDGQRLRVHKLASTPTNPELAVVTGVTALAPLTEELRVIHGSTVGLNAILRGAIARCAFVTSSGFRDLIELGRQDRPELYALQVERRAPLVPRPLRFELDCRAYPDGTPPRRPTKTAVRNLIRDLRRAAVDTVAVGFLHSYLEPVIERAIADALRAAGFPVTCSAELLPEHREYERFSTAVTNACLVPVMTRYLEQLERALRPAALAMMQSDGGPISAARAQSEPARGLFSGPAGGVVAPDQNAPARDGILVQDRVLDSADSDLHSDDAEAEDLVRVLGLDPEIGRSRGVRIRDTDDPATDRRQLGGRWASGSGGIGAVVEVQLAMGHPRGVDQDGSRASSAGAVATVAVLAAAGGDLERGVEGREAPCSHRYATAASDSVLGGRATVGGVAAERLDETAAGQDPGDLDRDRAGGTPPEPISTVRTQRPVELELVRADDQHTGAVRGGIAGARPAATRQRRPEDAVVDLAGDARVVAVGSAAPVTAAGGLRRAGDRRRGTAG
jgi:hypothetical protein